MGPADRMAVFSLPSGPRLDFSADRAAIEKTLDAIGPLRGSMVNGEFSISYTEALYYAQGRARGMESPIARERCEKYLNRPPLTGSPRSLCASGGDGGPRQVEDQERASRTG